MAALAESWATVVSLEDEPENLDVVEAQYVDDLMAGIWSPSADWDLLTDRVRSARIDEAEQMFEDSALARPRPVLWVDAGSVADRVDGAHHDLGIEHHILERASASGGKRLGCGAEPGTR